jgi:DHA2 family multidrug resistance protein-like MFS transporter
VAVAERLPAQLGTELLGAAREAFVQAFELVTAISAVLALATAILAVAMLRRVRPGSESVHEELAPGPGVAGEAKAG